MGISRGYLTRVSHTFFLLKLYFPHLFVSFSLGEEDSSLEFAGEDATPGVFKAVGRNEESQTPVQDEDQHMIQSGSWASV